MRRFTAVAAIAAVGLGLGFSAASAKAGDVASATTCVNLADQLKASLANNTGSANYEAAIKEQRNGREFCGSGLYSMGVTHYQHALELLGVQKS